MIDSRTNLAEILDSLAQEGLFISDYNFTDTEIILNQLTPLCQGRQLRLDGSYFKDLGHILWIYDSDLHNTDSAFKLANSQISARYTP